MSREAAQRRAPRFGGLALRIYFVSLAQLLAMVAAVLVVGWLLFSPERGGPDFTRRGRYAVDTIIEHLGDPAALQRELERARRQMQVSLSLYAADGELVGSNVIPALTDADVTARGSRPRPPPPFRFGRSGPLTLRIPIEHANLPGGYALYRPPPPPMPRDSGLWLIVIALVATAVASILLARSLARPRSQLSAAAQRFGAGDLTARGGLTRRDEFGALSQSFDEMAERVMQLVRSRQELLANVSHELRTPLARIRVALDWQPTARAMPSWRAKRSARSQKTGRSSNAWSTTCCRPRASSRPLAVPAWSSNRCASSAFAPTRWCSARPSTFASNTRRARSSCSRKRGCPSWRVTRCCSGACPTTCSTTRASIRPSTRA